MKRGAFLLIALVTAGLALAAVVRHVAAAPKQEAEFVVVDPHDLKKPVPDPELGVIPKYDGKVVRFTGRLLRATLNKKTKQYQYELVHETVHTAVKNKKTVVVGKDTVVISVTFQKHEKELLLRHEKHVLKGELGDVVTVQGKGEVSTDGTLYITDAVIVIDRGPILGREVKK